jgi:EAL domain-containing protein (putative c-di-GMP-specific phosphodiesterase class I)
VSGPVLTHGATAYPLGGHTLVGRADERSGHRPDLDLAPLDDVKVVSRRHAELEHVDDAVILRDLGSTNGTFVNGERLASGAGIVLRDGDLVRFGYIEFVYRAAAATESRRRSTLVASKEALQALEARPVSGAEQLARLDGVQRVLDAGSDALTMVFQPIVDLPTGRMKGVEALARFATEPVRTPDLWFDDAFAVGLGPKLELTAIAAALDQLERLRSDCYLSINASPETALSPAFREILAGLPADRLVLEVTEHAAVADYEALLGALRTLRESGLRLAVDDMGSGHANLKHILRLEPEIIKLDIELVRGLDRDSARSALAASLLSFAGEIGAMMVAEGVETEEEAAALRSLEVPAAQGFFFARPGPLPA